MAHPILYRRNAKRLMERTLDAAELRELLDLPEDATLATLDGNHAEIVIRWTETVDAPPEKPAKAPKVKKEEVPVVAAPPVEVDWAGALKDGARPTVADLRKAEQDAGSEKVVAVRGRMSLGEGVTCAQIAMQSNARDYFDALRADALGAK